MKNRGKGACTEAKQYKKRLDNASYSTLESNGGSYLGREL